MPRRTRRTFTPEFKAEVGLNALTGATSQAGLCRRHRIGPNLLAPRKAPPLERPPAVFRADERRPAEAARVAEPERPVGQQALEKGRESADALTARRARVLPASADRADTAASLRLVLGLRGFEVAVAHTGPDGVALARLFHPHAVVCDLGLPGMTGYDVARALRTQPEMVDSVLVAVSGYGQDDDRRKAKEAGFDDLRTKPADVDGLIGLLTGQLGRS